MVVVVTFEFNKLTDNNIGEDEGEGNEEVGDDDI